MTIPRQQFEENIEVFRNSPNYATLVELEQRQFRSVKTGECVCVGCHNKGTVKRVSRLIKSTAHYWMCEECAEYWAERS